MYYCITYLCLLNFVSTLMSYRLSGESAYRLHMHWLLPHARYIWSSFHFVNIFISFFFFFWEFILTNLPFIHLLHDLILLNFLLATKSFCMSLRTWLWLWDECVWSCFTCAVSMHIIWDDSCMWVLVFFFFFFFSYFHSVLVAISWFVLYPVSHLFVLWCNEWSWG